MGYFDADEQEMLEVYLVEAKQLTGQMSTVLLDTEKKNAFAEEDIHNIFRIMHTLKSSSAMMGLKDLSGLAHTMEDLFSFYREEERKIEPVPSELFDLLYAFSDYIELEIKRMAQPDYEPGEIKDIEINAKAYMAKIKKAKLEVQSVSEQTGDQQSEDQQSEDDLPHEMLKKGGVVVRIRFKPGCRMETVRAFTLVRQMKGICTDIETFPSDLAHSEETIEYIIEHGVFIRFETTQKEDVLKLLNTGLFVDQCELIQDKMLEAKKEPVSPDTTYNLKVNQEVEYLNVRSDRLDRLQNLARELIIHMMSLENQLEENGMADIKEGVSHQVSRLVGDVERTVMEMRMVPLEKIVPKLRRILRDICRDENKEVEFESSCGDIEADKSVVEYVSEALTHLIKNAIDHGIESPEERVAAGKERKGKIKFSVESTVGEVLIRISDDGRGMNQEKILEKAKYMGLLNKPEGEYSRQEALNLVLHPGFTTKKEVTEYSGRGVGLDVVKSVMETAGGNLYIESEVGKGSTFTLIVPLTLATMECIRFKVGEYRFSLPARYVYRFMDYRQNKKNIQEKNGRFYILFDGRMVPMLDLRKFYDLDGKPPDTAMLVYAKGTEKEGCLLVDSMYEQKRIVVKQLPPLFGVDFRRKTGVSGMSIMGNGKICTALDLEIMLRIYERGGVWN